MKILTQPTNKLNETALILELQAVQADAKVIIHRVANWNRFPYRDNLKCPDHITPPDDLDAPWTSPFYIEIANGDEADRAAFEAVIEAHDPQFTEQEERANAVNQRRAQELLDALLTLPDQYLAQIKARFDALP
jgi:hypothetical protein